MTSLKRLGWKHGTADRGGEQGQDSTLPFGQGAVCGPRNRKLTYKYFPKCLLKDHSAVLPHSRQTRAGRGLKVEEAQQGTNDISSECLTRRDGSDGFISQTGVFMRYVPLSLYKIGLGFLFQT